MSAVNHGLEVDDYLATIDLDTVGEIHLAGFTEKHLPQGPLYIDTHSSPWPSPSGRSTSRSASSAPSPP